MSSTISIPHEVPNGQLERFVSSSNFQPTADALATCEVAQREGRLHIVDGPLVGGALLKLCDEATGMSEFKRTAGYLGGILVVDALSRLGPPHSDTVSALTPNQRFLTLDRLNTGSLEFVLIPRAGLAFFDGINAHVPDAHQSFYDIKRDHETHAPITLVDKMPKNLSGKEVFACDPMLATGGSAEVTIAEAFERGAEAVHMLAMIPAPQGVARLLDAFPERFDITTTMLHWGLNDSAYIVPGLGDAGDRYFGSYE